MLLAQQRSGTGVVRPKAEYECTSTENQNPWYQWKLSVMAPFQTLIMNALKFGSTQISIDQDVKETNFCFFGYTNFKSGVHPRHGNSVETREKVPTLVKLIFEFYRAIVKIGSTLANLSNNYAIIDIVFVEQTDPWNGKEANFMFSGSMELCPTHQATIRRKHSFSLY